MSAHARGGGGAKTRRTSDGRGVGFGGGCSVYEVHEAAKVDSAVVAQGHFTSAAGAVAIRAACCIEMHKAGGRELRVAHAAIASHAAAWDA
jgi:hypothetical protein